MSKDLTQIHKLKNGLTIITCPNKNFHSFFIRLSIRVGSRYENAKTNGLAHLTEHLIHRFLADKIRQNYASQDYLLGEFNAYTDVDEISYELEAHRQDLKIVLSLLALAVNFQPRSATLKTEQGIIKEEILEEQSGSNYHFENFVRRTLFSGHNLGLPIMGDYKNVNNFTAKNVTDFVSEFYQPQNIILTITGAFDSAEVTSYFEHFFVFSPPVEKKISHFQKFICPAGTINSLPEHKKQLLFGDYFCLAAKDLSSALKLDFFLDLARRQLVDKIRSQALCYDFDITSRFYQEFVTVGLEASFEPQKTFQFYRLLHKEIENFGKNFSQKNLSIAKDNKIISLELDSDYPKVVAHELSWQYLTFGAILGHQKQKEIIRSFNLADFKDYFRDVFVDSHKSLLVAGKLSRQNKEKLSKIFKST